jgi:hypothetical protein
MSVVKVLAAPKTAGCRRHWPYSVQRAAKTAKTNVMPLMPAFAASLKKNAAPGKLQVIAPEGSRTP